MRASTLLAAAALAMSNIELPAPALRSFSSREDRRPPSLTANRANVALRREIAAHNAEVDRRKAAKKEAKLARKANKS